MSDFASYRRKQIAELRPWSPPENIDHVSISAEDLKAGSPKLGDMIARQPKELQRPVARGCRILCRQFRAHLMAPSPNGDKARAVARMFDIGCDASAYAALEFMLNSRQWPEWLQEVCVMVDGPKNKPVNEGEQA